MSDKAFIISVISLLLCIFMVMYIDYKVDYNDMKSKNKRFKYLKTLYDWRKK